MVKRTRRWPDAFFIYIGLKIKMTGIIPPSLYVECFVGPNWIPPWSHSWVRQAPWPQTPSWTTMLKRQGCHPKILLPPAVTSALPQPRDECNCFFFLSPSSSAVVLSHMRSNVLCAVCECAQGRGNEDRWGSFKGPGFTNREVSWSSNSPCSLSEAELPWCLIIGPPCKTRPQALEMPCLDAHNCCWLTRTSRQNNEMHGCVKKTKYEKACCKYKIEK